MKYLINEKIDLLIVEGLNAEIAVIFIKLYLQHYFKSIPYFYLLKPNKLYY